MTCPTGDTKCKGDTCSQPPLDPTAYPILLKSRFPKGNLAKHLDQLDPIALAREYRLLRARAPHRTCAGKRYLVHEPPAICAEGPPKEVPCAAALYNGQASAAHPYSQHWPGVGVLRLIDHQTPLKSKNADETLTALRPPLRGHRSPARRPRRLPRHVGLRDRLPARRKLPPPGSPADVLGCRLPRGGPFRERLRRRASFRLPDPVAELPVALG